MNKKIFNVLLFATGAAVGSLVTWKVMKTRYEAIIQEEVDSFKETYALCMGNVTNGTEQECTAGDELDDEYDPEAEEMIGYTRLASKYSRYSDEVDENDGKGEGDKDEEASYINGPYVIEPNDFASGSYNCQCITYYADGVLADDWGVKLDIEDTIGSDALKHFGDYAEDVVHVRNERLEIDYEVACDPRNYADVIAKDPLMQSYAD